MTERSKITILIVDDIPETRDNLRKLLYFEADIEIVGMAANGQEAIEQARKLQPNIVLMDINMPDMDGITASQEITRAAPVSQVIMMSVQSEADYLRRSMLAGAMDFLTKPFTSEELSSSIHRVYEMSASRRAAAPAPAMTGEGMPRGTDGGGGQRRPAPGGKLILVYSPKGGTGCSVVASNLAIGLHQLTSSKVALVDGSLQFGDIDVLLNLQGMRTVSDAVARSDELEGDILSAIMSPHQSGIKVLAAPLKPEMSETIKGEDIKSLLKHVVAAFDYVLLDTWSHLDDIVLAAMDMADRLVLVMTPEIPSIKTTKQFFEIAEALEFPLDRIDLVLNKVGIRDSIRRDQIERSMNHPFLAQIEEDTRVMRAAVNQGLPLLMGQPNHPVAAALLELARQELAQIAPKAVEQQPAEGQEETQERGKRAGLFGRLKR
ncbi:MAG: response regulator [Anaerolineae bacterium]|nr:response regulator [Anaerolineae bacterium]